MTEIIEMLFSELAKLGTCDKCCDVSCHRLKVKKTIACHKNYVNILCFASEGQTLSYLSVSQSAVACRNVKQLSQYQHCQFAAHTRTRTQYLSDIYDHCAVYSYIGRKCVVTVFEI